MPKIARHDEILTSAFARAICSFTANCAEDTSSSSKNGVGLSEALNTTILFCSANPLAVLIVQGVVMSSGRARFSSSIAT